MNVCYVSDRIIILISAYYYVTDFYYTTIIDTINVVWLCQTTINAGFSYSNYIHTFKPRAATLIPRSFSGFLPFTSHKSRTHIKHWCTPIIKSLSKKTIYSNKTVLKTTWNLIAVFMHQQSSWQARKILPCYIESSVTTYF